MPRALTVRQPWAEAIMRGLKGIENRSWPTSYRGPLLIHAGSTWDSDWPDDLFPDGTPIGEPEDYIFGAILGCVQLVDCVRWPPEGYVDPDGPLNTPWVEGPWAWVLEGVERFDEPIACAGKRGLWIPPTSLL